MSVFGGVLFTTVGRNLQAKAQAGSQLNFTRIAIGDGDLGGTTIEDLTALKHQVKSLNIIKLKTMAGGNAVVGTTFSNQDVDVGFYWKELGLFAQDPDIGEVLYCYGNAGTNAEYIPSSGGADIIEKSIDIVAIIGNAANVSATINESLVYVTKNELEDKVRFNQLNAEWDAEDLTPASGTLTDDVLCWKGKNVQYVQPTSGQAQVTVARATYDKLRFGHYSVGFRLKCSNITAVTAVSIIKVLTAAGTVVASTSIIGTDFAVVGANTYKTFYIPFDNSGQSMGNAFTFEFTSEAIASASVAVDSILVSHIHLANFGSLG